MGRNRNPLAGVSVFCDRRELAGLGGMGPGSPGHGHPALSPRRDRGGGGRGRAPAVPPSPQIDQLRAELLQERSSRQDLECDKVSLERQVSAAEGPHPAHGPAAHRGPSCSRLGFLRALPWPSPAHPSRLQGAFPLQQPNARSQAGCGLFPFLPVPHPRAEHPRRCLLVSLRPVPARDAAGKHCRGGPPPGSRGIPPFLAPWGHSERLPAGLPGL